MTQEDKNLLFKYLCMAMPYKVIIQEFDDEYGYNDYELKSIESDYFSKNDPCIEGWYLNRIENVKPYLRPISSMTDEEVDNLFKILNINEDLATEWLKVNDIGIIRLFTQQGKDFYEIAEAMDYLNSIHIDYRGLIEKGLAIEVTENNNPYKE